MLLFFGVSKRCLCSEIWGLTHECVPQGSAWTGGHWACSCLRWWQAGRHSTSSAAPTTRTRTQKTTSSKVTTCTSAVHRRRERRNCWVHAAASRWHLFSVPGTRHLLQRKVQIHVGCLLHYFSINMVLYCVFLLITGEVGLQSHILRCFIAIERLPAGLSS